MPFSEQMKFALYVRRAQRYAADRWLLDDSEIVREWCERSASHHARPQDLVDAYADKYDLQDPRADWWAR